MQPPIFFTPGQQLKTFTLYKKGTNVSARGRVTYAAEQEPIGTFRATIAQASPKEQERWGQMGHPVTHKIVARGVSPVLAGAAAEMIVEHDGRFWAVEGVHDPSGLHFFYTLFCNERQGAGK